MGFADAVGDAWDAIKGGAEDVTRESTAPIGAAFTAALGGTGTALKWAFTTQVPGTQAAGPTLGAATQGAEWVPKAAASGALGGLSRIGTGINDAYSYGAARPLSTLLQQQTWGGLIDPGSWATAWHNSRTLSFGQAATVNADQSLGIGPDWMKPENHPFSRENAPALQNYMQNTWAGKLSSGSTDLLLNIAGDPTAIVGKLGKAAELSRITVHAKDSDAVLGLAGRKAAPTIPAAEVVDDSKPLTTAAPTGRQARQAQSVSHLVDKIIKSSPAEIQAMPELQAPNVHALTALFLKAKADNPTDAKAAKESILDVIGTGWGDRTSMSNLVDKRAELASQMEAVSAAPTPNVAADGTVESLAEATARMQRETLERRAEIQNQIDQINAVVGQSGQVARRTGALLPEYLKSGKIARQAGLGDTSESWLNQGLYSTPIRLLSGATAKRLPQHINVQDVNEGFDQLGQYLGAMKYTKPEVKNDFAQAWVKASDDSARANIVQQLRKQIVQDIGRKHGYADATLADLLNNGESKMNYTRNGLSTRLYSAQGEDNFITFEDPEDGIVDAYNKPILKSQMEDHAPVLDPRAVEREFKSQTAKTLAGYNRYDLADIADAWTTRWSKIWKTSALARLAYPIRVQTDSQLRQMAHMETMAFIGSRVRSAYGTKRYLLSQKDKDGQSLRNFFKEGDYESSLRWTFTHDLGLGSQWNIRPDEMHAILSHILEKDGGMADLAGEITDALVKKRRTGDFAVTRPQDSKNWMPDYLRVVNRQAANSPSLRALLENNGAIDAVAARVRSQSLTGGDLWDEYRKIGKYHGSVEDYLGKVNDFADYYLPHEDLKEALVTKSGDPGVIHEAVARKIFKSGGGKEPLAKQMDVHGEGYSLEHVAADTAAFEKVRNKFFDMAGSMPENIMARAPLFMYSYKKNLAEALTNIPEDLIDTVGVENIRKNAMVSARKEMSRILYESSDLSNLSHSMRFISPFFGAWEDTMKKWGSLMYDNPQYLERLRQMTQAPNAVGMVPGTGHALVVDDNGNRVDTQGNVFDRHGNKITDKSYESGSQYILLPKKLTSWNVSKVLGGGNIKIRKDSINSVFQGDPWWLPGFGPAVQVPVNHLVRESFPKEANDPIMKYVLPYGTTTDSAADQLLPKWVKTARNAFGNTQDFAQQYNINLAQAVIANDHNPLNAKQLGVVNRKTKNYFVLKAITDNASPVSVQPDAKFQFYIDMANQYKRDPNRANWQDDYMKDFPGYGEMSISLSANNTGIQATNSAFDASKKYAGDIKLNPSMGWMFVGPSNSGQFSKGVYDWQQTNAAGYGLNYRSKKDPQTAMDEFQTEQGWNQWNQYNTAINLQLQQRGLHSTQQKGAEDLAYAKSAIATMIAGGNPAWAKAYENAASGHASQDLMQAAAQFMSSHPEVRNRADMQSLQAYETLRNYVAGQLALRKNSQLSDTIDNGDLAGLLQQGANALAQNNIGFEQMYNRALQYDNLSDAVTAANKKLAGVG